MKINSQKASILLSTLSFVILLSAAAASILELTMNSYRLTKRNELRVEARLVAESELENLYYKALTQILADQPASTLPTLLSPYADVSVTTDTLPSTGPRLPFLPIHQQYGWRIMRSISYVPGYDYFTGMIPNTTKHGKVTYVTVRIQVQPNDHSPFRDSVVVRVGRRFEAQKSSIFQYNVFFQGDMELAPGGLGIEIKGDIAANGSIYAAAQSGGSLTLDGKVRYLATGYFDKDSTGATVLRKPGTPISGSLIPPNFLVGQTQQVEAMSAPENLLGGVDAVELQARRPDLFTTVNDVYRAAILPPPGYTDEYAVVADDPTINASRMYTRAGLRVTVDTGGTVTVNEQDGTDVTADFGSIIVGTPNTPLRDARETTDVGVTTIDVGALKSALEAKYGTSFNGSVYFNLQGSGTVASGKQPKAIRLTNGAQVYAVGGNGMTVTTNGGIYIQGNYNTAVDTSIDASGVNRVHHAAVGSTPAYDEGIIPAMVMGDQVTVLSSAWDDSLAPSPPYSKFDRIAAAGQTTIQAGILTGNTPATSSVASGGVQNLVRFEEMWGGRQVEFFGSMGRLFDSKTFTAAWGQPGVGDVYASPALRTYVFDPKLRDSPPAGSPTTTAFLRGTFFVWTPAG